MIRTSSNDKCLPDTDLFLPSREIAKPIQSVLSWLMPVRALLTCLMILNELRKAHNEQIKEPRFSH